MTNSTKQITINSSYINIYADQNVVFIDRSISGCITLARRVKKVVLGSPPNEDEQ